MTKQAQSRSNTKKSKEIIAQRWNPDKMVDALIKGPKIVDHHWSEKRLPPLVDKIIQNYI